MQSMRSSNNIRQQQLVGILFQYKERASPRLADTLAASFRRHYARTSSYLHEFHFRKLTAIKVSKATLVWSKEGTNENKCIANGYETSGSMAKRRCYLPLKD